MGCCHQRQECRSQKQEAISFIILYCDFCFLLNYINFFNFITGTILIQA
jgi:hypothetical protein